MKTHIVHNYLRRRNNIISFRCFALLRKETKTIKKIFHARDIEDVKFITSCSSSKNI